ncbi:MAG: TetR family transcriptional regulator C-terminal domain-containing protein [Gammaproteobacteria bacterium]|nr:TetR family transcriptional regulator C-terminal domain-containing protein [Gammaproteobacteria bacterium]MDE2250677.1 TetR family transcriptional regulator C-terminal domain-containing protein [Gammaproteobacteria bacterium]
MTAARARTGRQPAGAARRRLSASRQRQRLIDACISALHIYGPSRTTVAKVVAIAKLSPGIVRFYFKSKAAMLVASLRFLSTEFDQLVLDPVAELRHTPVPALQKMVELYLDPEVASTRKISVWYAFWGEATARQEYQDICGQKDDRFANLVQELIGRMIERGGLAHLDPDAVSLGLIGVLEMLWQGFAFQEEEDIDRAAARNRAMAYLASVFPGHFTAIARPTPNVRAPAGTASQPETRSWDSLPPERRLGAELEICFAAAWQLAGHGGALRERGDFLTIELATGRALLVHDGRQCHAYDNSCPHQPHTLVLARRGRLADGIECPLHRLGFGLDGRPNAAANGMSLQPMSLAIAGGLVYVNPRANARLDSSALPPADELAPAAHPAEDGEFHELDVAADWKTSVEQLLLHRLPEHAGQAGAQSFGTPTLEVLAERRQLRWQARPAAGSAWTIQREATPRHGQPDLPWRRSYLWPNVLLEWRPDGWSAIQVLPLTPGRSRWQCFDYGYASEGEDAKSLALLARRISREALRLDTELAASTQRGLSAPGYSSPRPAPAPVAVDFFRRLLAQRARELPAR